MSAFVLGSTGLVGNHILTALNAAPLFDSITTVGRRAPKVVSSKINSIAEKDSTKWPEIITKESKGVNVFFSAFGTTKNDAGSAEKFVEIDYGINYDAAKAAKAAGVKTYVLVSSAGANASSRFLYLKTKGRLEDDIVALGFPETIILRPGLLLGERENSRLLEGYFTKVASYIRGTPLAFLGYPVAGEDLGKLAVKFVNETEKTEKPVVRIISALEIALQASEL